MLSPADRTGLTCRDKPQHTKTNPDVPRNLILLGHIRQKTTWFVRLNKRKPYVYQVILSTLLIS